MGGETLGDYPEDLELGIEMGDMHGELPQKGEKPKPKPKAKTPPPKFKIKEWTEEDQLNFEMSVITGNMHGEVPAEKTTS